MTVRFAVHTQNRQSPPGWIRVVVHDTVSDLRAAAARYAREVGDHNHDHTETAACWQGRGFRVHVDDAGLVDEPAGAYAGVLRLLPEHGVATVAHECTHAALALYYRQHALEINVKGPMQDEEVLCYAVGDLVGQIVVALRARGVWPDSA